MRRARLRPPQLPAAYRWYDRRTGLIDSVALAIDAMTGVEPRPVFDQLPPWMATVSLPVSLPGASLSALSRLSGEASRAWARAGRPGILPER